MLACRSLQQQQQAHKELSHSLAAVVVVYLTLLAGIEIA
jgi:hypothetical protein